MKKRILFFLVVALVATTVQMVSAKNQKAPPLFNQNKMVMDDHTPMAFTSVIVTVSLNSPVELQLFINNKKSESINKQGGNGQKAFSEVFAKYCKENLSSLSQNSKMKKSDKNIFDKMIATKRSITSCKS